MTFVYPRVAVKRDPGWIPAVAGMSAFDRRRITAATAAAIAVRCGVYWLIPGLDSFAAALGEFPAAPPASSSAAGGADGMDTVIRDISGSELRLFGDIVARLERLGPELDARAVIFMDVVRLLRGDFAASYVWDPRRSRFDEALSFNMAPSNLRRYEEWYQFRDPMTFALRARRRATLVDEVISREEMERTEFYNDFLARDGLHHGINMFIFDCDRDLGDLRIWRARGRPEFSQRDIGLLDALEPHLRRALLRGARHEALTPRESEVAALVARGLTDRDIGRVLGIGFGTVRTHLSNAMSKCAAPTVPNLPRRSCAGGQSERARH